jgi:DNA/RNA non-specific endonuclease
MDTAVTPGSNVSSSRRRCLRTATVALCLVATAIAAPANATTSASRPAASTVATMTAPSVPCDGYLQPPSELYTDTDTGYDYRTDAQGRPKTAEAIPLRSGSAGRLPCQTTVGKWGGADYDGGHLIADSFGGVSQRYNLVPMPSILNQSGGLYFKFEAAARGCLKTPNTVVDDYRIQVAYPDQISVVPNSYLMQMHIVDAHQQPHTIHVIMPEHPTDAQWVEIESDIEAGRIAAGC